MTTYNTGNPIGSKDPRDLYDNAENLDEAVNTRTAESWDDRFGVARKTWWGMEHDFQQFLIDSGYVNIGDYGPGLEITARNQIFWRDGELYRAGANLELPYTTTGDWGAEEGLFVAVGDQALRQQLADPNDGATMLGWQRSPGSDAALTVSDALAKTPVSLLEYSHLVIDRPSPDQTTWDWTPALDAALAYCSENKIPLMLPPFVVTVRANKTGLSAGGSLNHALHILSDTKIIGQRGLSGIKMADGESTDENPRHVAIFFTNGEVKNFICFDTIFDMNEANNKISPDRGSGVWSRSNCASIMVSGNSAWVDGLHFHGCEFNNTAGSSQIVTGQSVNDFAGPLSQNITITDCLFYNNGTDTADHSCVYAWGENVHATGNRFIQPAGLSKIDRNWVSFEVHGSNTWFQNNYIENFFRGCWIASNFTNPTSNIWVTDNVFDVWGLGPSLFRQLPSLTEISNVHIKDNNIVIRNHPTALAIKAAIELNVLYRIKDIYISGNIGTSEMVGFGASAFLVMAGGTQGPASDIGDVTITNNEINFAQYGVFIRTYDGSGTFSNVREEGNRWKNLTVGLSGISVGSYYQSHANTPIKRIFSKGQSYHSTSSAIGLRLEGPTIYIEADDSNYEGMLASPSGSNISIMVAGDPPARRVGRQLNTIANSAPIPNSTYLAGEEVYIFNPGRIKNIDKFVNDGEGWFCHGQGFGTTAERPTLGLEHRGYAYLDQTIGKNLVWTGTAWAGV